jgi:hypothetical protein
VLELCVYRTKSYVLVLCAGERSWGPPGRSLDGAAHRAELPLPPPRVPDTNTPFHNAARSDSQGLDKVGTEGG